MMSYGRDVTPIGNQRPRILHLPPRGLSLRSAGKEVVDLALMAGLDLDPWQQYVLEEALVMREDDTWAAREVGLVVSRQNGKGSILEALELGSLFLLDEEMCIHSAHLFDTSLEAFNRIMILIEQTPDLMHMVKRVIRSHGEEGIEVFREGKKRRLRFKTRTKGGGRGLTGDRVIIDEAMYFATQTAQALLPVVSARPNPQIWYTGSAGDKDSEHFGRVRQRGVEKSDPRLVFMEWSIDPHTDFCPADCDEHDEVDSVDGYAKSNPGLGIRITVETIESERHSMSIEGFGTERLGVGDWPIEGDAWRVIDKESWYARHQPLSAPQMPVVFAIDVTPDRKYSCIAVAGFNGEVVDDARQIHVEITQNGSRYDHRPGSEWVPERIMQLCREHKPEAVVIDKSQQGGSFVDELTPKLEKLGIQVLHPAMRDYAQACGTFHSSIVPRKGNVPCIVHMDQAPLTTAVSGVEKRELSDLWAWDKRNASVDISPLVAVTNAVWGLNKMATAEKVSPPWVMRR